MAQTVKNLAAVQEAWVLLGSQNREKESRTAEAKRPGRKKPSKIEQRKVRGLE